MESSSDSERPDAFETDEDSEFKLGSSSSSKESLVSEDEQMEKPSRKRKVNKRKWNINKKKDLRNSGKAYIGHKGKCYAARSVKPYIHTCRYKCNTNISEEERDGLFQSFYKLGSYDLQNSFLTSCIKKKEVARKKETAKNKNFSTEIFLLNKRVCKMFLLKTLNISNRRLRTVCLKTDSVGICAKDLRGKQPTKKMDPQKRNEVTEHIKSFPKYRSHYSRNSNFNTKYLSHDLNLNKMYKLYVQQCLETKVTPVKLTYYRFIFNTKFNLRFHRPNSDTCSKCDTFQNIIDHSHDEEKIKEAKLEQEIHQRKAQKAVDMKKEDSVNYGGSTDTAVICFDLQQTLPTPLLTTNKVFYLRQLWTYNFCVHNIVTGRSDMYIWDESISGRGSQEIGSCLIHFIQTVLPKSVTKLIAYSDSCGGQNKNKNIVKLFMFLVKSTHIQEIHHKFLEPGHTFMECDRDFGIIEKVKRKNPQVFIPDHWAEIILSSSKKFNVHRMTQEHFYSFEKLNEIISDPKKDTNNDIFKWRPTQYFLYEKSLETFSFSFKGTLNREFPFSKCICPQKNVGRPNCNATTVFDKRLNLQTIKINKLKWDNLQKILDFIPPVYHKFYNELPYEQKNKQAINKTKKKSAVQAGSSKKLPIETGLSQNEDVEDTEDVVAIESDYESQ